MIKGELTSLIKVYKAATFLMNMRCTVYGCQFTHELGYALRISIEELFQLCSGPWAVTTAFAPRGSGRGGRAE